MKRILIVDDDPDLLLLIKAYLQKNGFEVRTTTTCGQGLEIFYNFCPDLVLLDINIGNEDGREMCRQIKTQADYQHIPVVLFSANYDALYSFADYHASDAFRKPFDLPDLKKVLDKHLI